MATGDDIIGSIDRALWRVGSRNINNVTPFTYNDGLTYIDALEHIRKSVIDLIEFVNKFGDDQDKIIAKLNDTVNNFITEVEKTHSGWNKELDAKKTALESLIEDFKSRLIDAEFKKIDDGYIEAPLKSPAGERVTLPTKTWTENFKNTTNTTIDAFKQKTAEDLKNYYTKTTEDLKNYYTKTEAEAVFLEDPKLSEGVVFGSSNATIEASRWTEKLCQELGLNPNVYAIGGGGFTSTADNAFITQANNAIQNMSEDRRRHTKYVFVIDMLNDIRAQTSVLGPAKVFFSRVRTGFPNAEIKVLPVILNESSLNNDVHIARSCVSRTYECLVAAKPWGGVVAEGSRTWAHMGRNYADSWDQGADNVHMTDAGYTHIKELFKGWLNGGSSWFNPPSENLYPLSTSAINRDYNYLSCERDRDWVNITGTFRTGGSALGYDTKLTDTPGWARPYDGISFPIIGNDRTYKYIYTNKNGGLYAGDILSANQTYQVNFTYKIW